MAPLTRRSRATPSPKGARVFSCLRRCPEHNRAAQPRFNFIAGSPNEVNSPITAHRPDVPRERVVIVKLHDHTHHEQQASKHDPLLNRHLNGPPEQLFGGVLNSRPKGALSPALLSLIGKAIQLLSRAKSGSRKTLPCTQRVWLFLFALRLALCQETELGSTGRGISAIGIPIRKTTRA